MAYPGPVRAASAWGFSTLLSYATCLTANPIVAIRHRISFTPATITNGPMRLLTCG
jgi:hypothetical protein